MSNEHNLEFTEYEKKMNHRWVITEKYQQIGRKTTICLLTVDNGFEIVGRSACINPEDFDYEIGKFYAKRDALNKLDELVGFYRQLTGE